MWPVQKEGAGRRQKRGPQSSWVSAKASWVADTWTVPCPVTRTSWRTGLCQKSAVFS